MILDAVLRDAWTKYFGIENIKTEILRRTKEINVVSTKPLLYHVCAETHAARKTFFISFSRNMFNIFIIFLSSKTYNLPLFVWEGNKLLPINTSSSSLHCALHLAIFHRSNLVERGWGCIYFVGVWDSTIIIYHSR